MHTCKRRLHKSRLLVAAIHALALASALLAACGRENASGQSGSNAKPDELRIVSLSPAISRTLIDFGLQDRIVGRTPHCASIDPSIPVVGDLINIDY